MSNNLNLQMRGDGMRYRLQISTARLQPTDPEFTATKSFALERRRRLRESGYVVHLFKITPTGGLTQIS